MNNNNYLNQKDLYLNSNNNGLEFRHNNFDSNLPIEMQDQMLKNNNSPYNFGNDLYYQKKNQNILGNNSKFLVDNYPTFKGLDSPNIIQNNQNELFNQNINPKMDIFNQLDINHNNVLSKEEIMNEKWPMIL